MFTPALWATVFSVLLATNEAAWPQSQKDGDPTAQPQGSCRADPAPQPGVKSGRNPGAEEDEMLADRLADCGSVLAPPASGDPEMVKPAPDTGHMPVIPPRALPQTPPADGNGGE
ncbi:MAG: hypothetical protein AB7O39_16040 [Flavobacteriaceae bacterium]